MSKRYKGCNGPFMSTQDEPHCTKKHDGLELHMVFNTKKQRDEIFEMLRNVIAKNVKLSDVDLAFLSKNSGELQNCISESYCEGGYPDNSSTIYERKGNFGKAWLK